MRVAERGVRVGGMIEGRVSHIMIMIPMAGALCEERTEREDVSTNHNRVDMRS